MVIKNIKFYENKLFNYRIYRFKQEVEGSWIIVYLILFFSLTISQ